MSPPSIAPMRALLARCEQQEEAASRALAEALRAHEAALAAVAAATRALDATHAAFEQARASASGSTARGAVAMALGEHARFVARRRDERAAACEAAAQSQRAADERAAAVGRARDALSRAKGEREAVQKRIDAALAEARRVAEGKAEDEVADRMAAAKVASASTGTPRRG